MRHTYAFQLVLGVGKGDVDVVSVEFSLNLGTVVSRRKHILEQIQHIRGDAVKHQRKPVHHFPSSYLSPVIIRKC